MKRTVCILSLIVLAAATAAPAAITGIPGGTAAPGTTLGPYTMTSFGLDTRSVYQDYSTVLSPLGGVVGFSAPLEHDRVGSSWATWSNGYTGDVYRTDGISSLTITLPTQTEAFYFYAEPQPFNLYTIAATAQDGTQVSETVNGYAGAAYYGFYATGGDSLSSILVTAPQCVDFGVGEFGIASAGLPTVPAPAGVLLAALGSALVGCLRGRKML
jgi:hypothetical protein